MLNCTFKTKDIHIYHINIIYIFSYTVQKNYSRHKTVYVGQTLVPMVAWTNLNKFCSIRRFCQYF
jgi:hypothetical protein